jgi:hypothetical protein
MALFSAECGNCGSKEHATGNCPHGLFSSECGHCGSKDHATSDCPHGLLSSECGRCGSKGHATGDCPHALFSSECGRCGSKGHATGDCPHALFSSECGRCGSKGHATSDCPHGFFSTRRVAENEPATRSRSEDDRPYHSSGSSSDDGYSCLGWFLGLIAAAIAILFAVLTVIVTMPIWVGAIAVSVITAYLYSARRLREIGSPALEEARLIQVQRKRRTKIQVAPEFLKAHARWNPDLLVVGGSGILYAFLLGGILILYNTDRIGKAMFGIAAVLGALLAWKSGRKILELRISEAVLTAHQIPSDGPRNAAQIGFGLSCVASVAIIVLIIASVVNSPAPFRPLPVQVANQTPRQSTPSVPSRSPAERPQRTPFREPVTNVPAPTASFRYLRSLRNPRRLRCFQPHQRFQWRHRKSSSRCL